VYTFRFRRRVSFVLFVCFVRVCSFVFIYYIVVFFVFRLSRFVFGAYLGAFARLRSFPRGRVGSAFGGGKTPRDGRVCIRYTLYVAR